MSKIFCLMGKSSSGKDTIFTNINKDSSLDLKPIILYTTRPKRENETDGIEYNFINEEQLIEYEAQGKVIECRKYDTVYGPWYYATLDDGKVDLDNNNYIIIVTLEAYESLKTYFGKDKVYPIYIDTEDGIRLERAFLREKRQSNPRYEELCRRFLADNKDFSQENLDKCGITKRYENNDLNDCISNIKKDILSEI